jgi:hypothetical protein
MRFHDKLRLPILSLLSILMLAIPARAQEWVRDHMTQPDTLTGAGGSRAGAAMRMGAIEGALSVFADLRYNDNVRLEVSGESGTSLELGAKVGLRYPLSTENELTLDALVTHEFYLSGVRGSHAYRSIQPGSALGMNAYIGRAKLHPFITASLQEDPISSPVLNNTEVDPESWTAGDGPHKPNERDRPPCPANDASIVPR